MSARFCPGCGSQAKDGDRFCIRCGKKIAAELEGNEHNARNDAVSLSSFMNLKTEERISRFERKRKDDEPPQSSKRSNTTRVGKVQNRAKKQSNSESVLINIGIARENEQTGGLSNARGSKLPTRVEKHFGYHEVLELAVKKHSDHDQYFCAADEYMLLYPDHKAATTVPGSDKPFTIQDYKKELAKPYAKLDLYICRKSEFEGRDVHQEEKSDKKVPVIVVKDEVADLENQIYLDIDNFPDLNFPSFTNDTAVGPVLTPGLGCSQDLASSEETMANSGMANSVTPKEDGFNSFFGEPKTRCPVCNRKFIISMIEEHVDACLQSKETPFIAVQSSEEEADSFSGKEAEISQDPCEGQISSSECKELLVQAVKACHYKMGIDVTLNIRRGHEFSDFTKFFKKPWNAEKQGGTYRICYIGEAGIDSGGVSREFYSRAIMEVKSNYFIGTDDNGYEPYCGTISVADGTVTSIGHLFAAGICNGGAAPCFLSQWLFTYISYGLQKVLACLPSSLPPGSCHREIYEELFQASDDNRVKEIVTSDAGLELLEIVGYRGNPLKANLDKKSAFFSKSVFIKAKIEPQLTVLSEFLSGLKTYGLLDVIKEKPHLFQNVFCKNDMFEWDFEEFQKLLKPDFSPEGSNRKSTEISTLKHFLDFVEQCFNDQMCPVSFKMLMQFLTGSESKPILGVITEVFIEFIHDCPRSNAGTACKCLPTVSTCGVNLRLPVHVNSSDEMLTAFDSAIKSESGFGCC
eukprot:gene20690-22727_t